MSKCEMCKYAIYDYAEYIGNAKAWYVDGCKKDRDEYDTKEECEAYEEIYIIDD